KIQSFNNVAANINVKLKESDRSYTTYQLTRLNFNVKPI
ncbi:MAG: hypothetical protein JWR67_2671, partial [Mucilaginibacter sp.]|nr:hypothetical protein [Mucilaginibacter sp.]